MDPEAAATLKFGAGFFGSMPLSPERRAAFEAEEARIDAQLEAERPPAGSERDLLAKNRGESRHTVSEYLGGYAKAQDRVDSRELARQHSRECGCEQCQEMMYQGLDSRPSEAQLAKSREKGREFKAEVKAHEQAPVTKKELRQTNAVVDGLRRVLKGQGWIGGSE